MLSPHAKVVKPLSEARAAGDVEMEERVSRAKTDNCFMGWPVWVGPLCDRKNDHAPLFHCCKRRFTSYNFTLSQSLMPQSADPSEYPPVP